MLAQVKWQICNDKKSAASWWTWCWIYWETIKRYKDFYCVILKLFCHFLPVLALKYDESASSRETERPISTEGSHSSPRCSWVGEDGEGGGGRWTGEGGSEEKARVGLADWLKSREKMENSLIDYWMTAVRSIFTILFMCMCVYVVNLLLI